MNVRNALEGFGFAALMIGLLMLYSSIEIVRVDTMHTQYNEKLQHARNIYNTRYMPEFDQKAMERINKDRERIFKELAREGKLMAQQRAR